MWGFFQLVNKWLSVVYSGAREKSNNCFNSVQFSGFIIRTIYLLLVLNKSHTIIVGQQCCSGLKDTMLTQIFYLFFLYSVLEYCICPYCAVILAIGRRFLWKRTGAITMAHSFCGGPLPFLWDTKPHFHQQFSFVETDLGLRIYQGTMTFEWATILRLIFVYFYELPLNDYIFMAKFTWTTCLFQIWNWLFFDSIITTVVRKNNTTQFFDVSW